MVINKMVQQTSWQAIYCCASLRSGCGTLAQLAVYAVSRCVVCKGDFTLYEFLSACLLFFVYAWYDHKLHGLSAGANGL